MTVTYPNGGETLSKEKEYSITWTSTDVSGNINIELYKGDVSVLPVASGISNTGSYAFSFPVTLTEGNDYRIRISTEDDVLNDFSDGYFSIKITHVNLPRTGQTTCYDESGNVFPCLNTGQDGDIQAGAAWPEPRFVDNGDGTVTDHLTGLIWLKDAGCAGQMTWPQGLAYCNNLASGACGLTDGSVAGDWRLPNIIELESLVNAQASNPAGWLNTQGFSSVQPSNYWSATTSADNTSYAWNLLLFSGGMNWSNKSDYYYVWPVRAGQ